MVEHRDLCKKLRLTECFGNAYYSPPCSCRVERGGGEDFFKVENVVLKGFCVVVVELHSGSLLSVFVCGVGVVFFGKIFGVESLFFDVVEEGLSRHCAVKFPA